MKKTACWMLMMALAVPAAWASLNVEEDASGETALLTWRDPVPWQAGLSYMRMSRPVASRPQPMPAERSSPQKRLEATTYSPA